MILINTETGGALSSSSTAMGEFWVEEGREIIGEQNEEMTEIESSQTKDQDDKSTIIRKDVMQESDTLKAEYNSKVTKDGLLKSL